MGEMSLEEALTKINKSTHNLTLVSPAKAICRIIPVTDRKKMPDSKDLKKAEKEKEKLRAAKLVIKTVNRK